MFRMQSEMNLAMMMDAEKSKEISANSRLYIDVYCPFNVKLLIKINRFTKRYYIHDIHIQFIKALNASTKSKKEGKN